MLLEIVRGWGPQGATRRGQRGERPLMEGSASQGSQDAGMSDQSFMRLLSSVLRGSGTSQAGTVMGLGTAGSKCSREIQEEADQP